MSLKKIGLLWIVASWPAMAITQDQGPLRVPAKTEIFASLQKGLESSKAQAGDPLSAQVSVPVVVDERIVIPVGSHLVCRVERLDPESDRRGWLILACRKLILPSGLTRSLEAVSVFTGDPISEKDLPATDSTEKADDIAYGALSPLGSVLEAATGAILALFDGSKRSIPKGETVVLRLQNEIRLAQ